jgi:hypothetical protein
MERILSRATHLYSAVKFHRHAAESSVVDFQHLLRETHGLFLCFPRMPYVAASIRIIGLGGLQCPVRPPSTFYLSPYIACGTHGSALRPSPANPDPSRTHISIYYLGSQRASAYKFARLRGDGSISCAPQLQPVWLASDLPVDSKALEQTNVRGALSHQTGVTIRDTHSSSSHSATLIT